VILTQSTKDTGLISQLYLYNHFGCKPSQYQISDNSFTHFRDENIWPRHLVLILCSSQIMRKITVQHGVYFVTLKHKCTRLQENNA